MTTNYLYSIIARAAYKDFVFDPITGKPFQVIADLQNKATTFAFTSPVMQKDFTDNFKVIYQYNDPLTGFSGTVFQDKSGKYTIAFRGTEADNIDPTESNFNSDPLDALADIDIAFSGLASDQLGSLEDFINLLYEPKGINGTGGAGLYAGIHFDVVGDSLGGHLAQGFIANQLDYVDNAVIFEAPGINYSYFVKNGILFPSDVYSKITHIYGEEGIEIISGNPFNLLTGIMPSPTNNQPIVIEDHTDPANFQGINHGIGWINASLAIYDLFLRIQPDLNIDTISPIGCAERREAHHSS